MIADSYRKAVEAGDQAALAELYDPEALLDAHVANWRWRQAEENGGAVVRELHLLRLADDGRIAEQVLFCAGVWDPDLQSRMAAEAPLFRP